MANQLMRPNFKDFDFSVIKNLPISERVKVQLRAEMYNVFNGKNLASGAGSVGGTGMVTDTVGDFNGALGLGPGEPSHMELVGQDHFLTTTYSNFDQAFAKLWGPISSSTFC